MSIAAAPNAVMREIVNTTVGNILLPNPSAKHREAEEADTCALPETLDGNDRFVGAAIAFEMAMPLTKSIAADAMRRLVVALCADPVVGLNNTVPIKQEIGPVAGLSSTVPAKQDTVDTPERVYMWQNNAETVAMLSRVDPGCRPMVDGVIPDASDPRKIETTDAKHADISKSIMSDSYAALLRHNRINTECVSSFDNFDMRMKNILRTVPIAYARIMRVAYDCMRSDAKSSTTQKQKAARARPDKGVYTPRTISTLYFFVTAPEADEHPTKYILGVKNAILAHVRKELGSVVGTLLWADTDDDVVVNDD
jgi:hypothetical protein